MYKFQWHFFPLCCFLLLLSPVTAYPSQTVSPLSPQTAHVNGVKIHYGVGGSGPALLLIHGFTLNGSQWEPFVNDFMKRFTVIVPDLPGHGQSDPMDGAFSFQKTSRIMFGLLDQMEVNKVRCIGHSAGGITVLYMAENQPERIDAMALVASAHRMNAKGRQLLINEKFESFDTDTKLFYHSMHPEGEKQITRLFQQLHGIVNDSEEFFFPPDYLSMITMPTLLIWGDRDDYFPLGIAVELYQVLPDAQLWVIPGQGHTPIWTSMGGSENAAMLFPSIVARFFDIDKGTKNQIPQCLNRK